MCQAKSPFLKSQFSKSLGNVILQTEKAKGLKLNKDEIAAETEMRLVLRDLKKNNVFKQNRVLIVLVQH